MEVCDGCNSFVFGKNVFGGIKKDKFIFCNKECVKEFSDLLIFADKIPESTVRKEVNAIFNGNCPQCSKEGPVGLFNSHKIFSLILITTWWSDKVVCCKKCAKNNSIISAIFCLFLGWWGFPFGILGTPISIIINIYNAIFVPKIAVEPTEDLVKFIKLDLAKKEMLEAK